MNYEPVPCDLKSQCAYFTIQKLLYYYYIIIVVLLFHYQILARQEEYRKRRVKISADTSACLFMATYNKSLKYTNTQRLNCRCQQLDLTYLTVSLVPTWCIFTPPSEFLPHLENFIPNPTNIRNTLTIASTNILVD